MADTPAPGEDGATGTARALVLGYVDDLDAAFGAMRAALPSLDRPAGVLRLVTSRRIGRSGAFGSLHYSVHGVGCLFTTRTGREIDVDFAADGAAVFDAWRLRWYGRSLPEPLDLTEPELLSAARSLRPPLAEVRPGWFRVDGAAPPA